MGRTGGRTDGWMNGRMGPRVYGWTVGRADGQTDIGGMATLPLVRPPPPPKWETSGEQVIDHEEGRRAGGRPTRELASGQPKQDLACGDRPKGWRAMPRNALSFSP